MLVLQARLLLQQVRLIQDHLYALGPSSYDIKRGRIGFRNGIYEVFLYGLSLLIVVNVCHRDCQRKHWKDHKEECRSLATLPYRVSIKQQYAEAIFDTLNYKIAAGGEEPAAGSVPGGEGGHPGGHAHPERAPPGRGATDVDQACLPGLS